MAVSRNIKLSVEVIAVALMVGVAAVILNPVASQPLRQGVVPDRVKPTIVAGAIRTAEPMSTEQLALTYPEAAVQASDGSIYIANALGFAVERVLDDTAQTALLSAPDQKHPSIFTDLKVSADGSVLALDSTNGKIWDVAARAPVFTVPHEVRLDDASRLLSSFDIWKDGFVFISTLIAWQGQSQQYGIELPKIMVSSGDQWREIPIGGAVMETLGSPRDIAALPDGKMAVIAGPFFALITEDEIVASIETGTVHGGGILPIEGGWLIGAHTGLHFVPTDFSAVTPIPFEGAAFANVGHLARGENGSILLTDTDRQAVFEIDLEEQTVLRQIGNSAVAMKVVATAVKDDKLLLLENASPRVMAYDPKTGSIEVVAGDGNQGYDAPQSAREFSFQYPSGITVAPDASILVTDANYRIARVAGGEVDIFAGDINAGHPSDGQLASAARFGSLRGMSTDTAGNLLVVDQTNHSVWRIDRQGVVSKVMGTGVAGQWSEGAPAVDQPLNSPSGVLARRDGTILIADSFNQVVVGIDAQGKTFNFAGSIIGTGYQGYGHYKGDGGPAKLAGLNTPRQMVEDEAGNVYIVDEFNNAIRKVAPDGTISTFAGGKFGFAPDGSHMNMPQAASVLGDFLYVADTGNNIVWAFPLN